jgi:aerobic-type carbon monoxide dehydrogenase small subunit (CoxS/CutS family)
MQTTSITMTLNGQKIQAEVEPRQHLVDFLRRSSFNRFSFGDVNKEPVGHVPSN